MTPEGIMAWKNRRVLYNPGNRCGFMRVSRRKAVWWEEAGQKTGESDDHPKFTAKPYNVRPER